MSRQNATTRWGYGLRSRAPEAGVKDVAQGVAEKSECEGHHGEGQAGIDREPGRSLHVLAGSRLQHVAPGRGRRLHAEAEEAQPSLGDDGIPQLRGSEASPSEKGQNFLQIVIVSITVVVIAVPEGLPLAVTLALAIAPWGPARDMPRRAFEQRAKRTPKGELTGAGKYTADKAHLFRGTRYEPVKRLAKRSVPLRLSVP